MMSKRESSEKQAQFWELIRQGKSQTAAAAGVGVDRTQGRRWLATTG